MHTARQSTRTALHRNSLPSTVYVFARLGHALHIELKIVGDEQVQMAVTVVVDERAPGSPASRIAKEARFFRDIGERPIAVVVVEERAPATGRFDDVVVINRIAVDYRRGEPSGRSDVREMRIERPTRRRRLRLSLDSVRGYALRQQQLRRATGGRETKRTKRKADETAPGEPHPCLRYHARLVRKKTGHTSGPTALDTVL